MIWTLVIIVLLTIICINLGSRLSILEEKFQQMAKYHGIEQLFEEDEDE